MAKQKAVDDLTDLLIDFVLSSKATPDVAILALLQTLQTCISHIAPCKEPAMGYAVIRVTAYAFQESMKQSKTLIPYIQCMLCAHEVQFGTCEHDLSGSVDRVVLREPGTILTFSLGDIPPGKG